MIINCSSSSEDTRKDNDLGRFGLGLKSASLSQCRMLTVVSIYDNEISAYKWDYNHVKKTKNWSLLSLSKADCYKLPYINTENLFNALVKNDNDFGIILNVPEDISVNDYMIDTTCYSTNIDANSIGIFYFQLDGDSLEDCDITSFDKVEGAIEINDDHWNELDIAEISTSF